MACFKHRKRIDDVFGVPAARQILNEAVFKRNPVLSGREFRKVLVAAIVPIRPEPYIAALNGVDHGSDPAAIVCPRSSYSRPPPFERVSTASLMSPSLELQPQMARD